MYSCVGFNFRVSNIWAVFVNRTYGIVQGCVGTFKGLEYLDYMIRTQQDELIDADVLLDNLITVLYALGLD